MALIDYVLSVVNDARYGHDIELLRSMLSRERLEAEAEDSGAGRTWTRCPAVMVGYAGEHFQCLGLEGHDGPHKSRVL